MDLVLQVGGFAKSNEVKTGTNLATSSKEGYGSQSAGLPMVVVMMMMCIYL
jgi:hypothetical protein